MEINDLAAKNFETYPDVAADIINVLIYEGEQRTNKDSLLASPTETVYQGRENLRNQLEDVARYEIRNLFQSDMRIVVDYLAEGNDYRSDQKVVHKEALIKFLRTLSGEENVEDTLECLQKMDINEEDEITMCELFDQYTRQGIKEGLREGIQALIVTCKELGADFDRTEDKVKQRFHLSDADAAENMRLYW